MHTPLRDRIRKKKTGVGHQLLQADLDANVCLLLERYLVVMNTYLKKKGHSPTSRTKLVGAVITRFVLAHEPYITEEFTRIEVARVRRRLRRAATASPLPEQPKDPDAS